MVNYVNTVLVSNLTTGAVLTKAPKAADSLNKASDDAGKFIIMNCDPSVEPNKLYEVTEGNALNIDTIKVGIVTKKNAVLRKQDGSVEYTPIVKWSNEIKAADIKSFSVLAYEDDTEDKVTIDLSDLTDFLTDNAVDSDFDGVRFIVRLTYKDMPHRYRKWTESYEIILKVGDTKTSIANKIANAINKEWKRARLQASVNGTSVILEALPYDDDDSVDSLNWANKVRFNVNVYWTNPAADGWASKNKNFPAGVTIEKEPGKQYPASAKLVRDRESWAMGYQGILNRGEGTWPIIKPAMETSLDNHYDAITLEFENMYRAADDIQRKTKQTLEVYATTGTLGDLQAILASFVAGEASQASATANQAANAASAADLEALTDRVSALENAGSAQP